MCYHNPLECNTDVLFDDVQVEYRQGLLVQETQYDPAGLAPPLPGICGLNNYRFNGKEFQADLKFCIYLQ